MARRALIIAVLLLPALVRAQDLTCPSSAGVGTTDCAVVHYHVRVWNVDTNRYLELYGTNRFSSAEACEAQRAREMKENQAAVGLLKRLDTRSKVQPNQYGPCHCDMTESSSNPYFLDLDKRFQQIGFFEEALEAMRNELLDHDAASDSPEVRSLSMKQSAFSPTLWPKFVTLPSAGDHFLLDDDAKTMATKTVEDNTLKTQIAADLKLVDVALPAPGAVGTTGEMAQVVEPDTSPADELVQRETARIQSVLAESGTLEDDSVKQQIFEAMMQRLQALSNLRRLVTVAGDTSPLGKRIGLTGSEDEDFALVSELFGPEVRSHWIPASIGDVVLEVPPEIESDPVAVLRDAYGRFDMDQKRLALYLVMAKTPSLTSNEEVWLSGIMNDLVAAAPAGETETP